MYFTLGAIAKRGAYFGQGSGSIILDDVQCTGNEVSIFSCSYNSNGSHNCVHKEDAGVVCFEGQYKIIYIYVIIYIQFVLLNINNFNLFYVSQQIVRMVIFV